MLQAASSCTNKMILEIFHLETQCHVLKELGRQTDLNLWCDPPFGSWMDDLGQVHSAESHSNDL